MIDFTIVGDNDLVAMLQVNTCSLCVVSHWPQSMMKCFARHLQSRIWVNETFKLYCMNFSELFTWSSCLRLKQIFALGLRDWTTMHSYFCVNSQCNVCSSHRVCWFVSNYCCGRMKSCIERYTGHESISCHFSSFFSLDSKPAQCV